MAIKCAGKKNGDVPFIPPGCSNLNQSYTSKVNHFVWNCIKNMGDSSQIYCLHAGIQQTRGNLFPKLQGVSVTDIFALNTSACPFRNFCTQSCKALKSDLLS